MATKPFELQSLAFGSIGATYAAIDSAVDGPITMFFIQNRTDADMIFSYDGSNNHVFLPVGGHISADMATNSIIHGTSEESVLQSDTIFYVKQADGASSSGSVYVSGFYNKR